MTSELTSIGRSRILSNSCAEFVEHRAGHAIIRRVTESDLEDESDNEVDRDTDAPAFVSAVDAFLPSGQGPSEHEQYKPSDDKMKEFQDILKRFTEMLQKRKIFKKLGIESRAPQDYNLEYVMSVAKQIHEKKEGSENTRTCKRFVRKCCRTTHKHKDAVRGLIGLAPTDIYGSVISGGFAMILAAVEEHEQLRKEIQDALASIPKKLSRINRLSEVHIRSIDLHRCASSVFIAIFAVLERIIDRLSMNFAEKTVSKIKGHGNDIKDAIETLDESIVEFQGEVEVCTQLRMGRIEENGNVVKSVMDGIKMAVEGIGKDLGDVKMVQGSAESRIKELSDSQRELSLGDHQWSVVIRNLLYQFFASSPDFNPIDGTVNKEHALFIRPSKDKAIEQTPSRTRDSSPDSMEEARPIRENYTEENSSMVEGWLDDLDDFEPSPQADIAKCLHQADSLDLEAKDKLQHTMKSEICYEWLRRTRSCALEIRSETAPDEIVNFLSAASAMFSITLTTASDYPVLSFFCGLRKNASRDESDSGLLGLLKSLNGQLLHFIQEKRPGVDLSRLKDSSSWRKSASKDKYALSLFKDLLRMLPSGDVVFVILDSISRMAGDKKGGDKLVEKILQVASNSPKLVIKVLVTDCLPNSRIKSLADLSLFVPNDVDGGRMDPNLKSVGRGSALAVQEFQQLRDEL